MQQPPLLYMVMEAAMFFCGFLERSGRNCFLLLVFYVSGYGSGLYEQNQTYLDRSPDYFWNPNQETFVWKEGQRPIKQRGTFQAKGSAGMIPYTACNGKVYVLLARETWGTDKNMYCDLGGAVEVHYTPGAPVLVDTFLTTLLKEGEEESSYLYSFQKENILDLARVFSYVYQTEDIYDGFESVFAFYKVKKAHLTEEFLQASVPYIQNLTSRGLCPWGFQEKDDYQWIELRDLYDFLKQSTAPSLICKNMFCEQVEIQLRNHFAEALQSEDGMNTLLLILSEEESALSCVEETSL